MSLNPPSSSGSIGEGNRFPFAIVRGGARSVTQAL